MKDIEKKEDFDEMIQTMGKVVVVEFGAPWCGPCRMITPFFNKLENEDVIREHVLFGKVDVEEVDPDDLSEDLEINCMPTFLIYKDGEKVDELKGANREKLESTIRSYIPSQ